MADFWTLPPDLQRHIVKTYLSPVDAAIFRCAGKRAHNIVPKEIWWRARQRIYDESALHGHLEILIWLHEVQNIPIPFRVLEPPVCDLAARGGHQKIIEWLVAKGSDQISSKTFESAAAGGQAALFKWLLASHGHTVAQTSLAYAAAAQSGCRELLHRGLLRIPFPSSTITRSAILGQQFETLKWLREEWRVPIDCFCLTAAVSVSRYDIYEYLLAANCEVNLVVFRELAAAGRVDLMDSLQERFSLKYKDDAWVCAYAALRGQLETLKLLHEQRGCIWGQNATLLAAGRGHTHCLSYLLDNGCPCAPDALENAARHGHLDTLKFLHSRLGGPLSAGIASSAASQGHLDVLQWVHANGCAIDQRTCVLAASGGYVEILEWLRRNSLPYDDPEAADVAATNGRLAALKWLTANGCKLSSNSLTQARQNNDKEMIAWITSYLPHKI